jgi:hypothetical protein
MDWFDEFCDGGKMLKFGQQGAKVYAGWKRFWNKKPDCYIVNL